MISRYQNNSFKLKISCKCLIILGLKANIIKKNYKEIKNNYLYFEGQSKQIKKLSEENTKKFTDLEFLPCIESLVNKMSEKDSQIIPNNILKDLHKYEWKSFDEIFKKKTLHLFKNNFLKPENIKYGNLENCYFISAISSLLLHHLERFKNIFIVDKANPKGMYAVKFYIQGQPQVIEIDDRIPCQLKENKLIPVFSYSRKNEISILILEKAWAKLNKSYFRILLGTTIEVFSALLEAPSFFELIQKYKNKNKNILLWNKMNNAFKSKHLMCALTNNTASQVGLEELKNFTIIELYEIDPFSHVHNNQNKQIKQNLKESKDTFKIENYESEATIEYTQTFKLIKLRGALKDYTNFKGVFNKDSEFWSNELKKIVNFESLDDGIILLTLEEFINLFNWIFICKYEETFSYRYANFKIENFTEDQQNKTLPKVINENRMSKNFKYLSLEISSEELKDVINLGSTTKLPLIYKSNDEGAYDRITYITAADLNKTQTTVNLNEMALALIDISTKTKCYITLHQPEARLNKIKYPEYKAPLAFIIIAKYNYEDGSYSLIQSEFTNWEKIILECDLDEGEYHIFAKSNWDYSIISELVISTYADIPVPLYQLKVEKVAKDWLEKIMIDLACKNPEKEIIVEKLNLLTDGNENNSFTSNIVNKNNYTGFHIFYYENNSLISNLVIKLRFTTMEGINLLNYDLNGKENNLIYLTLCPEEKTYLLMKMQNEPWLCKLEFEQEAWLEQPIDYLINKFQELNPIKRKTTNDGIIIDEIKYDRGFLLILENKNNTNMKGFLKFSDLNNCTVENYPDSTEIQFILHENEKKIINIKATIKDFNCDENLKYEYTFNESDAVKKFFNNFKNQNQKKIILN
jgi:hypothetical protein